MYTLGINAVYHDSSACLVKDGIVIAAAEEERFTRQKHAKRPIPFSTYELPFFAIEYCLRAGDIELNDVDHVAYSYDPYQLLEIDNASHIALPLEPSLDALNTKSKSPWESLFLSYVINAPRQFADGAPHHLAKRFTKKIPTPYKWHFVDHHRAHEASAFFASPFSCAAVMTLDGRGELATTTYGLGEHMSLRRLAQVNMPHSLGLLYEEVTKHLGFLHSSDEYKVMALASMGKPSYLSVFRNIIQLGQNGSYTIAELDFSSFIGPARLRGEPLNQYHYDIASSAQTVLEETVMELAEWLYRETHLQYLCLAGGVALNCVLNSRLQRHSSFTDIWIQPAAGDAGTALGAALWVDAEQNQSSSRTYYMNDVYLGPQFIDSEIEQLLRWSNIPYKFFENVTERTAELLSANKIVGWFQGRMEFGPRALGARSILASPAQLSMQERLNELKDREDFRPVAPVVLEEEASKWFIDCKSSPFMLFVYNVQPDKAHLIPAALHVDGTARVQTVNFSQNALLHNLLKAFYALSDIPLLINTSFNIRGEPIVCTPRDAIACFWTSPLDALVIGSYILEKVGVAYGHTNIRSDTNFSAPSSTDALLSRTG